LRLPRSSNTGLGLQAFGWFGLPLFKGSVCETRLQQLQAVRVILVSHQFEGHPSAGTKRAQFLRRIIPAPSISV